MKDRQDVPNDAGAASEVDARAGDRLAAHVCGAATNSAFGTPPCTVRVGTWPSLVAPDLPIGRRRRQGADSRTVPWRSVAPWSRRSRMVDFLLFGVVLGHGVRCTGKVVSRCPWRVFGVLPDSGSKTRSDWHLSRHNVELVGSVRDRDSHEAERDRAHDVRNVTQSVHVLEERKHAGRQGPFVSVACHYLGLALEYDRELASGRRMRLGLSDLGWCRHEDNARRCDCCGNVQRRRVLHVWRTALRKLYLLEPRTSTTVVRDLDASHFGTLSCATQAFERQLPLGTDWPRQVADRTVSRDVW